MIWLHVMGRRVAFYVTESVSVCMRDREGDREREREDVCVQMNNCRPNHKTPLRIFKSVSRLEMFCSLNFPVFYEQRSKTLSWTCEVGQELLPEMEPSSIAGGNVIWWSHCREQYRGSFKKIELPAIPLLGIDQEKTKTLIWKETCAPFVQCSTVFKSHDMEAPRTSIDRRMDKDEMVHTYNKILLSCEKNEIMTFAATWMDLEIIYTKWSQTKMNII